MRARVICLASAKGGSGKTGLVATFGTFLSRLGKKVLIIDADFATNGLTLLYLKEVRAETTRPNPKGTRPAGLIDYLLQPPKGAVRTVRLSDSDKLYLMPASYRLDVEQRDTLLAICAAMSALIQKLRTEYDYIWIDAQAGADEMSQVVMSRAVCDEVVIVSEYDPMSAAGVERLKASLHEDLSYDRTWILLNKILPEFAESFGSFMEVAKYLPPISWDAEVVRAYSRRSLAIDSEAASAYTISVIGVLRTLLNGAIKEELSKWVEAQAAVIRQPIHLQYEDAEKEMKLLLLEQKRQDKKSTVVSGSFFAVTGLIAIGVFAASLANKSALLKSALLKQRFQSLFEDSFFDLLVGVAPLAIIVAYVAYTAIRLIKDKLSPGVETELMQSRLTRQRAILEERLKQLELMKSLDAETLLKQGRLVSSPEKRKKEAAI